MAAEQDGDLAYAEALQAALQHTASDGAKSGAVRGCVSANTFGDALKTYGQLIQWDYKYRKGDVRKRIDELNLGPDSPGAG